MEQFIIFSINQQDFALDITKVERIIEFQKPNQIPETSGYLLGVIKYNGQILPIINLSQRLFNVEKIYGEKDKVIVVTWKSTLIGLVVDSITGIKGYGREQYEQVDMNSQIPREYVQGFIKTDDGIIIVLDPNTVFNPEQERELLTTFDVSDEETVTEYEQ